MGLDSSWCQKKRVVAELRVREGDPVVLITIYVHQIEKKNNDICIIINIIFIRDKLFFFL